jgi:hypothetical protein
MKLHNLTLYGVCGDAGGSQKIRWVSKDNWYDGMNFTQSPITAGSFSHFNLSTVTISVNASFVNSSFFDLTLPVVMDDFYDTMQSTLFINAFNGTCGGLGAYIAVDSREGSEPPELVLNVVDFLNATILGTDVPVTYFDFESGLASTSSFAQADFSYDAGTNTLTPLVPAVFASTAESSYTAANNLQNHDCGGTYGNSYSTTPITSLNPVPDFYDVVCFNLSSQHNGFQFYGAIKILNNTNVRSGASEEFDFHWAMYSSSLTTMSNFTYSPEPPQANRNLTVSWTTTQPTDSVVRFRFRTLPSGNYGSWITVNKTELVQSHFVIISKNFMIYPAEYQIYATGTTGDNVTFTGAIQSFQTVAFQEEAGDFSDGVHIIVTDEANAPLRAFVSIDGLAAIATRQIQTSGQYGFSEVASFFGFGAGLHNFTVSRDGRATQNFSINVVSEPVFRTVKLLPEFACIKVGEFQTNTSCVNYGASGQLQSNYPNLNITSFYCQYDSSLCFLFDANLTCVGNRGGWNLYACVDGFHPAGFPVNSSVPLGTVPSDQVQQLTDIPDAIAGIFGTTGAALLGFVAIIISIAVGVMSGITTRSGIAIPIGFAGMLFAFALVGWLDWWIFAIFAIISAAIAASSMSKTSGG